MGYQKNPKSDGIESFFGLIDEHYVMHLLLKSSVLRMVAQSFITSVCILQKLDDHYHMSEQLYQKRGNH